ncbi:MAG: Pr6Pr family membrane protein [Lachnospiraceae bacterium]|nr:Pr6Pr family membrane protein [Lachnospiraceae bacterium]
MKKKIEIIFNILIVIFVVVGLVVMFTYNSDGNELVSHGIENFKYFTVLSNVFCGIVALVQMIYDIINIKKHREYKEIIKILKLIATTDVALTFCTVAFFLWPIYKMAGMYQGSNFFFHLIVPLLAIIDFCLLDEGIKIPFKITILSMIPSIIYGAAYITNILINGIGEWPDSNDWYGYLNWGYPVGVLIFAVTTVMTWIMAAILWKLNNRFITTDKELND